jgi:hypothetical protein
MVSSSSLDPPPLPPSSSVRPMPSLRTDATALAAAQVGVAMGAGGSAMAVVAADVVFLSNNLLRLPSAVALCRSARATIIANCVFAITVKLIAIVLAILGMLKLWHAVLIDVGSLLFVVVNGSSILLKSHLFEDPNHSSLAPRDHSADHDHCDDDHSHGTATAAAEKQQYQPVTLSVVNGIATMV